MRFKRKKPLGGTPKVPLVVREVWNRVGARINAVEFARFFDDLGDEDVAENLPKYLKELVDTNYLRVHQVEDLASGRVPISDRMVLLYHEDEAQTATMIVETIGPRASTIRSAPRSG
jgi:hypothetical protein